MVLGTAAMTNTGLSGDDIGEALNLDTVNPLTGVKWVHTNGAYPTLQFAAPGGIVLTTDSAGEVNGNHIDNDGTITLAGYSPITGNSSTMPYTIKIIFSAAGQADIIKYISGTGDNAWNESLDLTATGLNLLKDTLYTVTVATGSRHGAVADSPITASETFKLIYTDDGAAPVLSNDAAVSVSSHSGNVYDAATGEWRYTLNTAALVTGSYELTATAADAAGNASNASAAATLTVAAAPVPEPTLEVEPQPDNGINQSQVELYNSTVSGDNGTAAIDTASAEAAAESLIATGENITVLQEAVTAIDAIGNDTADFIFFTTDAQINEMVEAILATGDTGAETAANLAESTPTIPPSPEPANDLLTRVVTETLASLDTLIDYTEAQVWNDAVVSRLAAQIVSQVESKIDSGTLQNSSTATILLEVQKKIAAANPDLTVNEIIGIMERIKHAVDEAAQSPQPGNDVA